MSSALIVGSSLSYTMYVSVTTPFYRAYVEYMHLTKREVNSSRTENSWHCARIFFVPWTKQSKQYSISKIMGSIQLSVPMVLIEFFRWLKFHFFPGGSTPLCKSCRYVPPHRVGFLRRFGLKTGIHFAHFGLEMGMVFEGTTEVYERIYRKFPSK